MCFQQPAPTSHARPRVEVPLLLGLRLGLGLRLRLRLRLPLPEELVRHDLAVSAPIAPSYRSRACGAGGLVAVVAAVWSL